MLLQLLLPDFALASIFALLLRVPLVQFSVVQDR